MYRSWPLSLLLITGIAAGQVYRWVDEAGVAQYSQSPPPDRIATPIAPPPAPSIAPEMARQHFQEQVQQGLDDYLEDRSLAAEKQGAAQEQAARWERNCQSARQNQAALQLENIRRIQLPDGSYAQLTDAERSKRLVETREQIDQYCQ